MAVERVVVRRRTVLIGSMWMMTWARHVLSTKNSVQVNKYNIYKARKLDRWLNFTVTRHKAMATQGNLFVNENQMREQTKQK